MKRIFFTTLVFLGLCLMLGGVVMADRERATGEVLSQHMVAEAMLTAHFIDAALKAGMSRDEINAVLARVAERSAIAEFWISDEEGRIEFSNVKGAKFRFPTDSAAKTQTAPFADLLDGAKTVVVQSFRPRELDGALFKYVGVSGIDKPRIVQVGVPASKADTR